ncbi:hypothetical protein RRG08_012598 [Elysia crispata]|uniref:Uncharacterized protein n=1 Tax=Elysia crispata TaxID=231223 RepID=A0AAE1AIG9_9GAST|nr:hypothetical protein RRG08_012598 [Elysia crispata]
MRPYCYCHTCGMTIFPSHSISIYRRKENQPHLDFRHTSVTFDIMSRWCTTRPTRPVPWACVDSQCEKILREYRDKKDHCVGDLRHHETIADQSKHPRHRKKALKP